MKKAKAIIITNWCYNNKLTYQDLNGEICNIIFSDIGALKACTYKNFLDHQVVV